MVIAKSNIKNSLGILIMFAAFIGSSIGFLTMYKLQKEN